MSGPAVAEVASDFLEFVKVEGCDIFFYCDVSEDSVSELMRAVKKVDMEMRVGLVKLGLYDQVPHINIHIRSDGGDLYAGLAGMDHLKSVSAHVTTIAEGCVASAATLIFLGGHVHRVEPNAYILIHQLTSDLWGKFEELKDEMRQCDRLMRHLKRIYLRATTIPEKKLDKLLKRDLYLSYKKCIKYGLTCH